VLCYSDISNISDVHISYIVGACCVTVIYPLCLMLLSVISVSVSLALSRRSSVNQCPHICPTGAPAVPFSLTPYNDKKQSTHQRGSPVAITTRRCSCDSADEVVPSSGGDCDQGAVSHSRHYVTVPPPAGGVSRTPLKTSMSPVTRFLLPSVCRYQECRESSIDDPSTTDTDTPVDRLCEWTSIPCQSVPPGSTHRTPPPPSSVNCGHHVIRNNSSVSHNNSVAKTEPSIGRRVSAYCEPSKDCEATVYKPSRSSVTWLSLTNKNSAPRLQSLERNVDMVLFVILFVIIVAFGVVIVLFST